MIKVKLIDQDGSPVAGAIVMIDSMPSPRMSINIAAVSYKDGVAAFDCEPTEGEYSFKIFPTIGNIKTLKVQKPTDSNGESTFIINL